MGISKERLETIFDPAFSTKDSRVGMGLGLAMSYNIVRKHQGHIDLESTPDEGTQVTIRLPIQPPDAHHHLLHALANVDFARCLQGCYSSTFQLELQASDCLIPPRKELES